MSPSEKAIIFNTNEACEFAVVRGNDEILYKCETSHATFIYT